MIEILSSNVFGTEMKMITFINVIIDVIFLFWALLGTFARPGDESKVRFLYLVLAFLAYNVFGGFLPDEEITIINLLSQNIIAYSAGIILPVYYFLFITKELNIYLGKFYNPKNLLIVLVSVFLIGYILPYIIYEDFDVSRDLFIITPLIIGLILWFKIVKYFYFNIRKDYQDNYFKIIAIAAYLGIGFIACLPIVNVFGDLQFMEVFLVNIAFYLMAFAQIKRYIFISRMESKIISNYNNIQSPNKKEHYIKSAVDLHNVLTERQFELAPLIVNLGYTYEYISEITFISKGTVSKHASNIFERVKVSNRKEFSEVYSEVLKDINNIQ